MTFKSRVTLLVSGAVIFFILAPAAIFFARGFRYDFSQRRVVKTGTLVIKTDPRGAQVTLSNQKLSGSTPLTKRFLVPGEYSVEITKPGYYPWQKKIAIYSQEVFYLPQAPVPKIPLFLETTQAAVIATSTQDFFLQKDSVYYLSGQMIYRSDIQGKNPTLAATTTSISLDSQVLHLANNNETGKNYWIDSKTRMLGFTNSAGEKTNLLSAPLPEFKQSKIILSSDKQVFLLLDNDLYQVKETLKKIASGVAYASWNNELPGLVYGNSHEIWLYNPEKEQKILVTRSLKTLGEAQYNGKTGYLFVVEDQKLKGIEFDSLGQPNIYTLFETKTSNPKFALDSDGTYLLILDGPDLISLKIR
jgi:hypothetical protein